MGLEDKTCWLSGAKVIRSGNDDYRLLVYVKTLNNSKHLVRVGKVLLVDDTGEHIRQLVFRDNNSHELRNVGGSDNHLEYDFELPLSTDEFETLKRYRKIKASVSCEDNVMIESLLPVNFVL